MASITRTKSVSKVSATVLSVEPAVHEEGERKGERKRTYNGREYTVVTFLPADADEDDTPETLMAWIPFETAQHIYTVGSDLPLLIEEEVERKQSLAGVATS